MLASSSVVLAFPEAKLLPLSPDLMSDDKWADALREIKAGKAVPFGEASIHYLENPRTECAHYSVP